MLKRSRRRFPFVERVFADGGYAGKLVTWAEDKAHIAIEVVRRLPFMTGFVVLRRRWVVERTFAWIMKCRRLVRDYGCRNTHHHRSVRNPDQAMAVTLLKHALRTL